LSGSVRPDAPLVIIADDEEDQCAELAFHVETLGYRTLCFTSGEDALAAMVEHRPMAMLLDINLPARTGIRIAELVGGIDSRVRIYMISGSAERCEEAKESQLGTVLSKPLSRDMLSHILPRL
jgi:FixJ family two-component response regulator